MVRLLLAAGLLSFCFLPSIALADTPIYSNDFEGSVGSEWSSASTDVTPIGAREFLGQFHNDTISLTLNNMPSHAQVQISFDLFVIRTWDGSIAEDPNYPGTFIGPDVWTLDVVGGPQLLNATFNNHDFYAGWTQSYPGTYPEGDYLPRTGATENNSLGYTWGGYGVIDSVYHMSFAFSHSDERLSFMFAASTIDSNSPPYELNTESWGLDNVQVSVSTVPEPSSILALFTGLISFGGMALKKLK